MRAISRQRRAVLTASALAVLAVGCSSDGSDKSSGEAARTSEQPTASATTATTETVTRDIEDDVFAGYRLAVEAFQTAARTSDPSAAALVETHTGPMLQQTRDLLTARRRDGRASRPANPSRYGIELERVELLDDGTAELTVCVVDDGVVFVVSSGEIVNDEVETARDEAVMRLEEGRWKLAERRKLESWPGVGGCAVD